MLTCLSTNAIKIIRPASFSFKQMTNTHHPPTCLSTEAIKIIRPASSSSEQMTNAHHPPNSRHVAVIGAGAGGLVAARELRREGHSVVVYERLNQVGGTWIYDHETESDPVGINPDRKRVHGSLYKSLRTNLPRESMGFIDFPFSARDEIGRDARRFPGHEEVLRYLVEFAHEFGVIELVRFECEVESVELVKEEASSISKWRVRSRVRNNNGGGLDDEVYDAVVVCNGHYTEPRVAEIEGIDVWPGKQIHSHNYRVPEPFRDQVVILIGSSASAVDISRDIALVAKEVHVASRSSEGVTLQKQTGYENMWLHSMIESAHEDGTIIFQDGNTIIADVIMHCTGYKYHFPFLETNGIVTMDDNRVEPLYKHVFPPLLTPSLSFVGLPWKVIPFPLCELQSKWIAGVLSGRIDVPSQEEMMEDIKGFYSALDSAGMPKRYTHNLSGYQFEYDDWLAAECGLPPIEEWRKGMYAASSKSRSVRPETYRDEWEDQHLVSAAAEDFKK